MWSIQNIHQCFIWTCSPVGQKRKEGGSRHGCLEADLHSVFLLWKILLLSPSSFNVMRSNFFLNIIQIPFFDEPRPHFHLSRLDKIDIHSCLKPPGILMSHFPQYFDRNVECTVNALPLVSRGWLQETRRDSWPLMMQVKKMAVWVPACGSYPHIKAGQCWIWGICGYVFWG